MESWLETFAAFGPHLHDPLVLIGFALLLFFGTLHALLKTGIIPPLTPRIGGKVVQLLLRYGFVIALVVIALGFALRFWPPPPPLDVDAVIQQLMDSHRDEVVRLERVYQVELEDWKRQATEAVSAFDNLRRWRHEPPGIDEALHMLEQGRTAKAEAIFLTIAEGADTDVQEAAAAYRHLGALAFIRDRETALEAYLSATRLDPDNADGWNQLGLLYLLAKDLDAAEAAYGKLKALAESQRDQTLLAVAFGSLGNVYRARGDLERAAAMCRNALALLRGVDPERLGQAFLVVYATKNSQPYPATVEVYPSDSDEQDAAKISVSDQGAFFTLIPGSYHLRVVGPEVLGRAQILEFDVVLEDGKTVEEPAAFEEGYLNVQATRDGKPANANVSVFRNGENSPITQGQIPDDQPFARTLPPGNYSIEVEDIAVPDGPTVVFDDVLIRPGETEKRVVPLVDGPGLQEVRCGTEIRDSTTDGTHGSLFDRYSCTPGRRYDGPEKLYSFQITKSTGAEIRLSGTSQDLDVFALKGPCDPEKCEVGGDNALYWGFERGDTWCIVVDGHEGAAGGYNLAVKCDKQ